MSNPRQEFEESPIASPPTGAGSGNKEVGACLWIGAKWFLLATTVGLFIGPPLLCYLQAPLLRELTRFQTNHQERLLRMIETGVSGYENVNAPVFRPAKLSRKDLAVALGLPIPKGPDEVTLPIGFTPIDSFRDAEAIRNIIEPRGFIALSPLESIFGWLKVAVYFGIVMAGPFLFYKIWIVVADKNSIQNSKPVSHFFSLSVGLFWGGILLGQFFILPLALTTLLNFNEFLGLELKLRLNDWLSFALFTPISIGIAFQMPLLMFVLDRDGILSVELYIRYRMLVMVGIVLLFGLLAPAPDPVSVLVLGIPFAALYCLGIFMCKRWPRFGGDLMETSEQKQRQLSTSTASMIQNDG